MIGILLPLEQILDSVQQHKGHTIIRKQNCMGCNKVLAVEITDKLGQRGEYWVVKDALHFKTGTDFLYGKEVWFGNFVRCLNCGREGRLPMDKPLNAEQIAQPKEVKDGKNKEFSTAKAR